MTVSIAMGATPKSWYALATPDDGPAEVMIYDDIGMFGVTAADFVRDVSTIEADAVTIRINSYGGDVFEGIAIANTIRGMDAATTTVVDGIAASIASVIALAADKVVMNQYSQMMVHNAWNFASGNADELQRVADGLRSMSTNISAIYAAKAGGTPEEWQALMNAETWYTADEAVAAGLADEAILAQGKMPTLQSVARASASLMHFRYPGREAAPAPIIKAHNQTPQASVEAEVHEGKETTVATLSVSALETLGLDAEADQDAVNAAIIELGNRQPANPEPVVVEPTLAVAQAVVTAAGQVTMEADAFAALQDAAQQGAQARAQQIRETDERAVDAAIARGAVAPARRDHHLAALAADRDGHSAVLTALASGLVPLAEVGHGKGTETVDADDALYSSLFGTENI
jgi:ATP-dependent protease ClpP protease subunit